MFYNCHFEIVSFVYKQFSSSSGFLHAFAWLLSRFSGSGFFSLFTMSDDDEYEEKEFTVYLDFESYVTPEELESPGLDFKIIGVDADHPVVQINGKLFRGTYDFCVGTHLFFDEDPNPPVLDPLFDITPNQFYRLFAKTQKIVKMERIFVEKLRASGEAADCDVIAELKIRKQPNMSYSEALNHLLLDGGQPPRVIPNEDIPLTAVIPDDETSEMSADGNDVEMSKVTTGNIKIERC